MFEKNHPSWTLLDEEMSFSLKQSNWLKYRLKLLGAKRPSNVEFLTIDEKNGPVHVAEGAVLERTCSSHWTLLYRIQCHNPNACLRA